MIARQVTYPREVSIANVYSLDNKYSYETKWKRKKIIKNIPGIQHYKGKGYIKMFRTTGIKENDKEKLSYIAYKGKNQHP